MVLEKALLALPASAFSEPVGMSRTVRAPICPSGLVPLPHVLCFAHTRSGAAQRSAFQGMGSHKGNNSSHSIAALNASKHALQLDEKGPEGGCCVIL